MAGPRRWYPVGSSLSADGLLVRTLPRQARSTSFKRPDDTTRRASYQMSASPDLLQHLSAAVSILARAPAGLITDLDGTLCPIADRPDDVRVPSRVRLCLARLAQRLDLVAVVSGRSVEEARRLVGVDGIVYVGNHGLEWWEEGRVDVDREAEHYTSVIMSALEHLRMRPLAPGVILEEKGVTASIHYRQSPNPTSARATILDTLAHLPTASQLRVQEGRMVVNLLPPVPVDKGTAVEKLVRARSLRGVLYLGDDLTDLDAFRALRRMRQSGLCRTLCVAVASPEAPSGLLDESDYSLTDVDSVVRLLEALACEPD